MGERFFLFRKSRDTHCELTWKKRALSFLLLRFKRYVRQRRRNWTRKRNRNDAKRAFPVLSTEPSTVWMPRFSRGCRAPRTDISLFDRLESHQFPCLHEFSIILFIPRQRHLTDSIHTRTWCASRRMGFTVDGHGNLLKPIKLPSRRPFTTLCDVLCNHECKYRLSCIIRKCMKMFICLIFFYNHIHFENVRIQTFSEIYRYINRR